MKTTEKIALVSLGIGAAAAAGLYYLDTELHWGWYLGAFALVGATCNTQLTKQAAIDRIANEKTSN